MVLTSQVHVAVSNVVRQIHGPVDRLARGLRKVGTYGCACAKSERQTGWSNIRQACD